MSDLCCKDVSIRINPHFIIDCATEDPLWVSGHTDVNQSAYDGSTGYLLTMRLNAAETETLLAKYSDSNAMIEKASVLQYCRSGLVYHSAEFKFVFASADTIYTFDPATELTNIPTLVTDPIGLVTTDAIKFVYVPFHSKTYGQFQVGGSWYIGEIDLTAGTLNMLGLLSDFWSNMTYSPITDSLYGTTGGNSLKRFSLDTNSETTVAAVAAQDCCWDSDQELLYCFGDVITEFDTATEFATVVNNGTWAYHTSKFPAYCSSIHKFYVVGYNSDSTQKIVYSYDTEDQRVQDVWHQTADESVGYYGVFPVDDTTMFAAIYDIDNPGTDGFRKLCASGFLEPYLYFKFDNDAVPAHSARGIAVEERNGMEVINSNFDTTATIDNVEGIIDNGCQLNSVPAVDTQGWTNTNLVGSLIPIWTNDIWNADFTIRIWVNIPGAAVADVSYNWVGMINSDLKYDMVGGATLTFDWRWKGDAIPSSHAIAAAASPFGWHRVIIWYKKGIQIGIKVDNNASVTTAVAALRAVEFPHFNIGGQVANPQVDEFAIFKGLVLTEAEMLADWNEGRGATWSPETSWEYPDAPEE